MVENYGAGEENDGARKAGEGIGHNAVKRRGELTMNKNQSGSLMRLALTFQYFDSSFQCCLYPNSDLIATFQCGLDQAPLSQRIPSLTFSSVSATYAKCS